MSGESVSKPGDDVPKLGKKEQTVQHIVQETKGGESKIQVQVLKVRHWNDRGFGFLERPDEGDIFVHKSAFIGRGVGDEPPQQIAVLTLGENKKKRFEAVDVCHPDEAELLADANGDYTLTKMTTWNGQKQFGFVPAPSREDLSPDLRGLQGRGFVHNSAFVRAQNEHSLRHASLPAKVSNPTKRSIVVLKWGQGQSRQGKSLQVEKALFTSDYLDYLKEKKKEDEYKQRSQEKKAQKLAEIEARKVEFEQQTAKIWEMAAAQLGELDISSELIPNEQGEIDGEPQTFEDRVQANIIKLYWDDIHRSDTDSVQPTLYTNRNKYTLAIGEEGKLQELIAQRAKYFQEEGGYQLKQIGGKTFISYGGLSFSIQPERYDIGDGDKVPDVREKIIKRGENPDLESFRNAWGEVASSNSDAPYHQHFLELSDGSEVPVVAAVASDRGLKIGGKRLERYQYENLTAGYVAKLTEADVKLLLQAQQLKGIGLLAVGRFEGEQQAYGLMGSDEILRTPRREVTRAVLYNSGEGSRVASEIPLITKGEVYDPYAVMSALMVRKWEDDKIKQTSLVEQFNQPTETEAVKIGEIDLLEGNPLSVNAYLGIGINDGEIVIRYYPSPKEAIDFLRQPIGEAGEAVHTELASLEAKFLEKELDNVNPQNYDDHKYLVDFDAGTVALVDNIDTNSSQVVVSGADLLRYFTTGSDDTKDEIVSKITDDDKLKQQLNKLGDLIRISREKDVDVTVVDTSPDSDYLHDGDDMEDAEWRQSIGSKQPSPHKLVQREVEVDKDLSNYTLLEAELAVGLFHSLEELAEKAAEEVSDVKESKSRKEAVERLVESILDVEKLPKFVTQLGGNWEYINYLHRLKTQIALTKSPIQLPGEWNENRTEYYTHDLCISGSGIDEDDPDVAVGGIFFYEGRRSLGWWGEQVGDLQVNIEKYLEKHPKIDPSKIEFIWKAIVPEEEESKR